MPRRDYRAKLAADNAAILERSRRDRDIAPDYPPPGDLARREACEGDLRRFCEAYFPAAFRMAWSDDHLRVIARMETVILEGGQFALAMPRGAGKTTLSVRAALWALLYGHRRFVCLVGATEKRAGELLKHIKAELSFNETLGRDFRQVCYPLVRLENNARKAIGQLFNGEQTRIEWAADRLVFPIMPDVACDGVNVGGSVISVAGITGAVRGQSYTLDTGEIIRPELAILDDPQTRESAMSPSQSEERAAIINGDVLGMAGPDVKISAIMPCTVIRAGDMADRLLDRKKSPRWQGERTRMLNSFPTDEKLWERYNDILQEDLEAERGTARANELYRQNRAAMDAGAEAAWTARFKEDEISAIQCAMNLKLANEAAFMAEYQNQPILSNESEGARLTAEQIVAKLNGINKGLAPADAEHLASFIDVHDDVLYYAVAAFSTDFTGWLVDYGTWPEQGRRYFVKRNATHTLQAAYPGAGREGAIRAGLVDLTERLMARDWAREDGATLRIACGLIDAGYTPEVVEDVCLRSPHAAVLKPSRGVGITASGRPISEYDRTKGDRIGHHWFLARPVNPGKPRHLRIDTNYWKSFVHARLAVALGDRGCMSLYGSKPEEHRMLADHLTAEFTVRTSGQGRELDEWKPLPSKPDNHLFDCCVGVTAAASFCGSVLPGAGATASNRARRRLTREDFQRPQRRA